MLWLPISEINFSVSSLRKKISYRKHVHHNASRCWAKRKWLYVLWDKPFSEVWTNRVESTFIFCSPICSTNCGVVFLWKYILVLEKWLISFNGSNMQIFPVNITRVVWPQVTNVLDLRYFCEHNPLFYHLSLIPCRYWNWQRYSYFLVNIFVRHTFPMSKSSIKTKTVLTMTDMTQSTELQAFIRQKDGYKS